MSYYMADRKHRKAFLEARQSLEVKLNLEEQSQQQVKQYSILCVIVWLVGLWLYICSRDILNNLSSSLYEILIANVWSVSVLSKLNSLQGSARDFVQTKTPDSGLSGNYCLHLDRFILVSQIKQDFYNIFELICFKGAMVKKEA